MAIYRGSGGANEATDAATNQASAAAEYARQASESALDTQELYDLFDDTYLGAKSTIPTLDNDGNALAVGALYFYTVENKIKVYSDIGWIDSAVASPSSFVSQAFSGTGAQVNFTLSAVPSSVQSLIVFVAGIRLRPTLDYAVASTTLTFVVAPALGTNNISVLNVTTLASGTPDDNTISTVKLQNGSVTLDKLALNSVDSSRIVDGSIVVSDLSPTVLTATNIVNTPAGGLASTTVQAALNELDTEKANLSGATFTGDVIVPDEVYGAGWNGSLETPTKNAVYDKLQTFNFGRVLAQVVTFQTGAVATGTTVIPYDDTIPQQTEGDQYMSLAITPQNASSTLEIDVLCHLAASAAGAFRIIAALFQDSTASALVAESIMFDSSSGGQHDGVSFKYMMTAGTIGSTTFKVRGGLSGAGTATFNGAAGARIFGGVMASRITIKEYLP